MKFKKGDRVKHEYLGEGTFIKEISFMSLVKWDNVPAIKYNMGTNPCVIFTEQLIKLNQK